jgi:predicted secreted Zn-dependent protease
MRACYALAAAIVASLVSASASAEPLATTKYQYYSINGNSAAEIYRSMLSRGPRVDGAKAYAATTAQSSQAGFLVQGQSCRIRGYKFKIDFVIKLPRMASEAGLSAPVRNRWHQFSAFLRKHEETHRSIWTGCAREFESKVATLKSGDCDTIDAKAAQLWDKVRAACDRKHEAFDAAQQKVLARQPFVKLAFGLSSPTVAAASVTTKKRKKTAAALAN